MMVRVNVNLFQLLQCIKYNVESSGGVVVIMHSNPTSVRRLETDCEIIWIELKWRNKHILFGVYYCPPNTAANLSQLCCSLSALPSTHHILLCDKFNVPYINWDTTSVNGLASDFCNTVHDIALQQLVDEPTRQSNIQDLALTNFPARILDVEVTVGSNHCVILFNILYSTPHHNRPTVKVYNFKNADFDYFRDVLSVIPWNCCFLSDSIEDGWSSFKSLLFIAADQSIPRIYIWRNRKWKSWLSNETGRWSSLKWWIFRRNMLTSIRPSAILIAHSQVETTMIILKTLPPTSQPAQIGSGTVLENPSPVIHSWFIPSGLQELAEILSSMYVPLRSSEYEVRVALATPIFGQMRPHNPITCTIALTLQVQM